MPRRRRFHFLIGACTGACIALAAIVGAWALGLGPFAPVIGVPAAFADRITVEGDGGFTYLFPEEDIAYDADKHALYADDTLIAYLEPGVGARERLALADRVGGGPSWETSKGASTSCRSMSATPPSPT